MHLKEYTKVVTREHDLLKAKMERDQKARQGAPEAQKEAALTQTPENKLSASCGDPVALVILLKAKNAEVSAPVR